MSNKERNLFKKFYKKKMNKLRMYKPKKKKKS